MSALTIQAIDTLKNLLGTMVIEPQYESDPNNIGKRVNVGSVQKPILEGKNREIALAKVIELVESLQEYKL